MDQDDPFRVTSLAVMEKAQAIFSETIRLIDLDRCKLEYKEIEHSI